MLARFRCGQFVALYLAIASIAVISTTGCSVGDKSALASERADYWRWRAERARENEARKEHCKSKKAEAKAAGKCCKDACECPGEVVQQVKSEYVITLEKDMEIEGIQLDYEAVAEQAKLQAKLDESHKKAMVKWAQEVAQVKEDEYNCEPLCLLSDGCVPVRLPDCAQPERQQTKMPPPPKRPVLGMEELPIVIRAKYKMRVQDSEFARSDVEDEFLPAKQPCLPNNFGPGGYPIGPGYSTGPGPMCPPGGGDCVPNSNCSDVTL